MSLFKLALTVAFMIAVCAPALAETIVDENLQASTPQNTSSVPENRSEDLKTPKTQPIELYQILHCCACTSSSNQRTPISLHTPSQSKK
jgi:hypothetical protein